VVSQAARGVSRRHALAAAGAAGAAALGGCSTKAMPSNVPLTKRTPGAATDVGFLTGLLGHERYAIAAYTAAIPLLSAPAARAGKQFLAQELAHATELEGLIEQAGGEPPKPPADYVLGIPGDERQLLELLHEAERAQLESYLNAIRWLTPPRIRGALAAIVSNDAQHVAVLRARLGLPPVPAALVTARE